VRGARSGSTVARNQFRRSDSDSQPTTSVDTDTSTTAGITDDLPGVTVRRDPNRGRVDVDDLAVQQVDDLRQRVGDSIDTRIDTTGSRVSSVADDATDTIESGARQVLEADSIADVAPVSARDLGRSFERTASARSSKRLSPPASSIRGSGVLAIGPSTPPTG